MTADLWLTVLTPWLGEDRYIGPKRGGGGGGGGGRGTQKTSHSQMNKNKFEFAAPPIGDRDEMEENSVAYRLYIRNNYLVSQATMKREG